MLLAAVLMLQPSSAAEKPGNVVVAKLEGIRLPNVAFDRIPVNEAVGFISRRVVELDPDPNPAMRGVSFLMLDFPPPPPTITFSGGNVPVTTLLQEISKQAKVDIHLTSVGIVIGPVGRAPFPNSKGKTGEIWKTLSSAPKKTGSGQ